MKAVFVFVNRFGWLWGIVLKLIFDLISERGSGVCCSTLRAHARFSYRKQRTICRLVHRLGCTTDLPKSGAKICYCLPDCTSANKPNRTMIRKSDDCRRTNRKALRSRFDSPDRHPPIDRGCGLVRPRVTCLRCARNELSAVTI